MKKAAIAQLAERQTEDLKVAGSTPARGNQTIFLFNECEIMKELRNKLKNELEGLDKKTINLNLLESIEYFYYSKNYSGKKKEKKKDNKGIREIKKFIRELYIKFGEYNKKVE